MPGFLLAALWHALARTGLSRRSCLMPLKAGRSLLRNLTTKASVTR